MHVIAIVSSLVLNGPVELYTMYLKLSGPFKRKFLHAKKQMCTSLYNGYIFCHPSRRGIRGHRQIIFITVSGIGPLTA